MADALALHTVEKFFPDGVGEIAITSPRDPRYNCIAWAAGDDKKFWWPTYPGFWPKGIPRDTTLSVFRDAYSLHGFEECEDGALEIGFEKIAIYVDTSNTPTHAARQLADGKWTSKLGPQWDISHVSYSSIEGDEYGRVAMFMRQKIR